MVWFSISILHPKALGYGVADQIFIESWRRRNIVLPIWVNSLRSSDAYTYIYTCISYMSSNQAIIGSDIITCRLIGAKPLFEPMLGYYQLDP